MLSLLLLHAIQNRNELSAHDKQAHPDLTKRSCFKCGTICKSKTILQKHIRVLHHEGQFGCSKEQCGVVSKTRQAAVNHYNKSHKPFVCRWEGCDQSFRNKCGLTDHEREHSGSKPYHCKYAECSYATNSMGNIKQHIRMLHFKLPRTIKEQQQLGIVDDRDCDEFIQIVAE